jgi:hypothetical protein
MTGTSARDVGSFPAFSTQVILIKIRYFEIIGEMIQSIERKGVDGAHHSVVYKPVVG